MSSPRTTSHAGATPHPLTEVTLRDGTPALIWPLLDTDGDLVREAFNGLSPLSRQRRFLRDLPELSDAMLRLLVDGVDGANHMALLLTVLPDDGPARPVGGGRLVRTADDPTVADVAVTVRDAWQGRGVGDALLTELLARRPADVALLRTEVAADNPASLALLSRHGTMTTRHDGHGVHTVEISNLPASAVPLPHAGLPQPRGAQHEPDPPRAVKPANI